MNLDLSLLIPEVVLLGVSLTLLVVHLLSRDSNPSLVGWVGTATLTGLAVYVALGAAGGTTASGTWLADPLALFFKLVFLLGGALVTMGAMSYGNRINRNINEFLVLVLFATLALMLVVSAGDLISLYIGLELIAITFVVLVSFERPSERGSEAGLKYLVLNAVASAVMLYGLSLLYGLTGSLEIATIAEKLSLGAGPAVIISVVLVLVGFGFKAALVPFHMWSPDVFEGSPTPVTAFFAIGSEAAAFGLFIRIFLTVFSGISEFWGLVLIVLSAATMVWGNLIAIPQTNIKRFLAYASIGSAGYIIMGIIAASEVGVQGVLFYTMIYVFSMFGALGVAIAVGNATGSDDIEAFSGLWKRAPFLAVTMLLTTLSMAGIPGLAGFVAKFLVFWAVIDRGLIWLPLLGAVMNIVAVYYFLNLARKMYVESPVSDEPIRVGAPLQLALVASLVITIFLGIYPTPLINLAAGVAASFLP